MDELDRFVLTEDLPEQGLRAGDLGTIVVVHDPDSPRGDYSGPAGYTAEFTYLTGETRAVVDLRPDRTSVREEVVTGLRPDQVRPAEEGDVARATLGV